MKKCIFTIVAKNYIGLAQILQKSIQQFESTDFFIVVADDADGLSIPANTIIAKQLLDYEPQLWENMSYKYTLTEFCTAIKPACFLHLFNSGYDNVIYFDPDIYVFSPLTKIWESLSQHDMALTPHISGIHTTYQGESEWAICVTGIFNLGFCAVRNTPRAQQAMNWWKKRLKTDAFCNRALGTFTDQKWMDWMPGFFGNDLCVLRDLGMNIAPWNYFERQITRSDDGQLFVSYRYKDEPQQTFPLIFMHYSGYDYKNLMKGIISHQRLSDPCQYQDIELATAIYSQALIQNKDVFNTYLDKSYSYNTYTNGVRIDDFHRKLYDGLIKKGVTINQPFSTEKGSFYWQLKRKKMLTKESIDKLTPQNYKGMNDKIKLLDRFFNLLFCMMGYKRYPLFIKSLYHYSQPQNHSFIIK